MLSTCLTPEVTMPRASVRAAVLAARPHAALARAWRTDGTTNGNVIIALANHGTTFGTTKPYILRPKEAPPS